MGPQTSEHMDEQQQQQRHRERQRRHYRESVKADPERLERRRMTALVSAYRRRGTTPTPWSKLSWYCERRNLVAAEVVAGRQRLPAV